MNKICIEREISDYKITMEDIKNIEDTKQCKLPEDYQEFLLQHNGGEPNFDAFEVPDDFPDGSSDFSGIRWFFGIDHNSYKKNYDLFEEMNILNGRVPKELLPIACDSFGNIVCIGVKDKHHGKIYFWDHENEVMDEGKEPWWDNITLIAKSFTDLLNSLCKFDLGDNDESILTYQDGTVRIIK